MPPIRGLDSSRIEGAGNGAVAGDALGLQIMDNRQDVRGETVGLFLYDLRADRGLLLGIKGYRVLRRVPWQL